MSEADSEIKPIRTRRWRRTGWLATLLAVLVALPAWLAATETGLRVLFATAEAVSGGRLQASAPSGRLLGPLRLDALRWETADLRVDVHGVALDWRPSALFGGRLAVDSVAVDGIDVAYRPDAESAPVAAPESLDLPLAVEVDRIEVGRLAVREIDGAEVFSLSALGGRADSDGQRHRVERLAADLPIGATSNHVELTGEIAAAKPFVLDANAVLTGKHAGYDYRAEVAASGDLLAPRLRAEAQGAGSNGAHLAGKAEVDAAPFAPLPLRGLNISVDEIDPARFAAAAPAAALRIEAALAEMAAADGAMVLAGPLSIVNRKPAALNQGGLPVERVVGNLQWRADEVAVEGFDLRTIGGGHIEGRLAWRPDGGSAIDSAGKSDGQPDRESSGESGSKSAGDAVSVSVPASALGRLTAALRLQDIDTARLDTRLPRQVLAGALDAEGDENRQTVKLALRAGVARIDGEGEVFVADAVVHDEGKPQPERHFRAALHLRDANPRALYPSAPQAKLNLDVDGRGVLGESPQLAADFALVESRFQDRPAAGKGHVELDGTRLAGIDLMLDVGGNRVTANGAWGGEGDALKVAIAAPALDAIGYGFGGRADVDGVFAGTLAEPAGSLRLYAQNLRLPGGVRVAGANGQGWLEAGADGAFTFALGASGIRTGDGDESGEQIDAARLSVSGRRSAHVVDFAATHAAAGPAHDALQVRLEGGADISSATPHWLGRLARFDTDGRLKLSLSAPTELELSPSLVRLGTAELNAGEQGHVRLVETRWSPAQSVFSGSLSGLAVGFGRDSRRDSARGASTGGNTGNRQRRGPLVLGAEWNVRLADTIEGDARVFRESGDIRVEGELATRLGLEELEARLTARASRLTVSLAARGTEAGELSGTASVQAERDGSGWRVAPDAPLTGSARLDMPSIAWLGRLLRENVDTAGRVEAGFSIAGTLADPRASGRIDGSGLEVMLADQGLVLSGGELLAEFDRDHLRLVRFDFSSANRVTPPDKRIPVAALTATPGTLKSSGELALESGEGRFEFAADRLPLLQRADRWLIVSGKGSARSTWTTLDLDADFRADAGYVEMAASAPPSLSDDVVILGRDEKAGETALAITADVRVGLGKALYLSALGVDTRLSGELRLRQQPGQTLNATGSVATEGGTYRGYGQQLSIERGMVTFDGSLENPALNVVALRKGLAVEAGVSITGTARRPQVHLVSEPSVPDTEKLSWMVLGRGPDTGGDKGGDLAMLLPAAQALLGGGMADQLTRSLGFDTVSFGRGDLNTGSRTATSRVVGSGSIATGDPASMNEQVLSLGKRLSSDLTMSFEHSLGDAEALVKLSYQLSRRVAVVARAGADNALDLYYTFSFR